MHRTIITLRRLMCFAAILMLALAVVNAACNTSAGDTPANANDDGFLDLVDDDTNDNGVVGDNANGNNVDTNGDATSDNDDVVVDDGDTSNDNSESDRDPGDAADSNGMDDTTDASNGNDNGDAGDDTGNDDTGTSSQSFTFSLTVARHVDQPFSNAEADSVLATASALLQVEDTECPDVATACTMARSGDVTAFDLASAVVTSESQLDVLFEQPADIKVVKSMIGVCGITDPTDMTIILGCAYTSGSLVIVHDADPDVWAHEWGHVQGLPHRDNCPRNIMHSYEILTNAVNAKERQAFLTPTPSSSFLFGRVAPNDAVAAATELQRYQGQALDEWVNGLVSRDYFAGLPASAISGDDALAMSAMLTDRLSREADPLVRRNVARAVGFTGDGAACTLLINELERLTGVIDIDELNAAAELLLALGRLAVNDPTDGAVEFLIARTDPTKWENQGIELADNVDGEPIANVLARISVMALGISHHPAARAHLTQLAARINGGGFDVSWLAEQVDEALARFDGQNLRFRAGNRALRQP